MLTRTITASQLIERYDGFLLDAYGVLLTSGGVLPGAAELIRAIEGAGKRFVVVTNDASRTRETSATAYSQLGLCIQPEQIVTSGSMVALAGIDGARCVVLGTPDAQSEVERGGGHLVEVGGDAEVVVIADELGYDLLPTMDIILTMIVRRIRDGGAVRILLPNPDVVYPKGDGAFGMASGSIAAMLSTGLARILGSSAPTVEPLGKPHPPIFGRGIELLGIDSSRVVMVGDQFETDILGAHGVGLDSALVLTGVAHRPNESVRPTWILDGLTFD